MDATMPRYRILEQRGEAADAWIRVLDKFEGRIDAFGRHILIENKSFYQPAPMPRGAIMIPAAAVTREATVETYRISLTVCRDPKFLLLEEIRG